MPGFRSLNVFELGCHLFTVFRVQVCVQCLFLGRCVGMLVTLCYILPSPRLTLWGLYDFHPLCSLFLIGFIGVTLVHKIIQVSSIQFYNTSSVHCVVCSPPQVTSPSITIYPPLTPPPFPLVITMLLSVSMRVFFPPESLHIFFLCDFNPFCSFDAGRREGTQDLRYLV